MSRGIRAHTACFRRDALALGLALAMLAAGCRSSVRDRFYLSRAVQIPPATSTQHAGPVGLFAGSPAE